MESNAAEAYEFAQTDSTYLQELRIKDTLAILQDKPIEIDSVQGIFTGEMPLDSIAKDSLAIDIDISKTNIE